MRERERERRKEDGKSEERRGAKTLGPLKIGEKMGENLRMNLVERIFHSVEIFHSIFSLFGRPVQNLIINPKFGLVFLLFALSFELYFTVYQCHLQWMKKVVNKMRGLSIVNGGLLKVRLLKLKAQSEQYKYRYISLFHLTPWKPSLIQSPLPTWASWCLSRRRRTSSRQEPSGDWRKRMSTLPTSTCYKVPAPCSFWNSYPTH